MKILDILRKAEATEKDYNNIFNKKGRIYTFLNPYGYNLVRKKVEIFDTIDGIFFDGILLCLFYRIFYGKKISRRSFDMTTVARNLFDRISTTNETIYFIGAREEEIQRTMVKFKEQFGLNIVGYRNGFFQSPEEREIAIKKIIDTAPDFVIVGMGAIIQDQFIVDLKKSNYTGIAFTCGGFLHQAADNLYYFPEIINKLHLRSIYRLIKEKQTRKRFKDTIIYFPINFLIDKFR